MSIKTLWIEWITFVNKVDPGLLLNIISLKYSKEIHLLEAEIFAATNKKDKAKVSFNAAISAARSAKFIHEQGLACELAALHCLKYEDTEDATNLFRQAQECYKSWGSDVKVDSITKQLAKISSTVR